MVLGVPRGKEILGEYLPLVGGADNSASLLNEKTFLPRCSWIRRRCYLVMILLFLKMVRQESSDMLTVNGETSLASPKSEGTRGDGEDGRQDAAADDFIIT